MGEKHTAANLVEIAFSHLELDWKAHVTEDPSILTRPGITRIGDFTHLNTVTGWKPGSDFGTFIRAIVEETRIAQGK